MSSDARAEARRRQREERKRTRTVVVGDGIVATEIGHHFNAKDGAAELPPKQPGRHRWVATAAYVLSDLEAAEAYDDSKRHLLDASRLMYLAIGCWDCEQPLGPDGIAAGSRCPAPG